MKTDRLSPKMNRALNQQITREAEAAQSYLALAAWADQQGYSGISSFLFRHATEERGHMLKFLRYILNRGSNVKLEALSAPGPAPKNIQDCFNKVFEQEVANTESIHQIVKLSHHEEDWATWNFLQWFVQEQVEEETLALNLLDKIKIAGGAKAADEALLELNKELGRMSGEAHSATEATE